MINIECSKCGFVNAPEERVCIRCGYYLAEADKSVAPASESVESRVYEPQAGTGTTPRTVMLVITCMMVVGSIAYRLLVINRLEQTSALFIGLPALLALVVIFTPKARSPMGMILKGVTICLLMSGILLGEGFICIVMAAPIFYLVAVIIGLTVEFVIRKRKELARRRAYSLMFIGLLACSLEGTSDRLSFPRDESVTVKRIVPATSIEVERAIASTQRFEEKLPFYLRLGFPRPVAATGSGLQVGEMRSVEFAGGEGPPGTLTLKVTGRGAGWVKFAVVSDTSHISHWLDWKDAEISWQQIGPGRTTVNWTLNYARRLDPAWYFGPWERYAVGLAADYLARTVAAPAAEVR